MKLLRRGASTRRKTEAGPVGVAAPRWRAAEVSSRPMKVVTGKAAPGMTSSLLDCLRSRTASKVTLTLLVVAGNLMVGVVLAVTLSSTTRTAEQFSSPPTFTATVIGTQPPEKEDPNNTLPGGHRMKTKHHWRGRPASSPPIDVLAHPTPSVVISHTASAPCYDTTECSERCRDIQDEHMGGQLALTDIASNFLVGGNGDVYEGRGWDVTNNHAGLGGLLWRKNVDISFIGDFMHDEPTIVQLQAVLKLLDLGVKLGKLTPNYKLFAHNDTDALLSPGMNIVKNIKDWPHFTHPSDALT